MESVRFVIWWNIFPVFCPAWQCTSAPQLLFSAHLLLSAGFCFSQFKASFELNSVHHFYDKGSLRPLVFWALLATCDANECVQNVEIRTVTRPCIHPKSGSQRPSGERLWQCCLSRSTEYRVPGPRHFTTHAPCESQALDQPLGSLCGDLLARHVLQHQLALGILSTTQWGCYWGDTGRLEGEPRAPLSVWQVWGSESCSCMEKGCSLTWEEKCKHRMRQRSL